MNVSCSKCKCDKVTTKDLHCPKCGFELTAKSFCADAIARTWKFLKRSTLTACPICTWGVPPTAKICPNCDTDLSAKTTARACIDDVHEKSVRFVAGISSFGKLKVQRLYLLLSACGLWGALEYVSSSPGEVWAAGGIMAFFYLAVLILLARWFVPKQILLVVVRRTTGKVKAALVHNYLTLFLLSQVCLQGIAKQAAVLVGTFLLTWGAAYLTCRILWPHSLEFYSLFFETPEKKSKFDPRGPQGRYGRYN
jgi:hypothetical protein